MTFFSVKNNFSRKKLFCVKKMKKIENFGKKSENMLKHRWRDGTCKILPRFPPKCAHFGEGGKIFWFFIQFLSYGLNTLGGGNMGISRNSYPSGWPIGRSCGHPQPILFWILPGFWPNFGYFHQNFTKSQILKFCVNYIVPNFPRA